MFSLWPMPAGVAGVTEVDLRVYPDEFLQCAGTADRMTIEVRVKYPDGLGRLFTVGRRGCGDHPNDPSEEITWAEQITRVHTNEVFEHEEASELFLAYLKTRGVPDEYERRGTAFATG